jgi:hypothetical protein
MSCVSRVTHVLIPCQGACAPRKELHRWLKAETDPKQRWTEDWGGAGSSNRDWPVPAPGSSFSRKMPFPLAHPAAVLPLRCFCPRYLSFPALIIGSLTPDLGYMPGLRRLADFSHRFFAGSFGFCLPVGLLLLLGFHLVRARAVGILPARYRQVLSPLCQRPIGSPLVIVISLLLGAWTHLFLDAITHPDEWMVQHLPVLRDFAPAVGRYRFRICEILYAGCTFGGVAWVALCYLRWLERAARPSVVRAPGVQWVWALLLAGALLLVAESSRGSHRSLGIYSAGIISLLLVIAFLWGTEN